MLGQLFGQQRALERIGDVMFARVDLGAVDRDRDPHGEFFEEFAVELVQLGRVAIVHDAERAHGAIARCHREGGDPGVGAGRPRGVDDAVGPELVELHREPGGEVGYARSPTRLRVSA